jgi:hypothetical protein
MFLLKATKKGFSSKEIQRQLGLKRYEPVWAMVHKLRKVMGNRDDRYTLEGMVEIDEVYFIVYPSKYQHKTQKAGRDSKTKPNSMVMAESTVLKAIETGKVERQWLYFKAKALKDHQGDGTDKASKNTIDQEHPIVIANKSTSHDNIADYIDIQISEKSTKTTTKETLKWVHIAIDNTTNNFAGNYRKTKEKYLQLYLNEFVYKQNRTYFLRKKSSIG